MRRKTQHAVSFPASPEEINRDMLSPMNAHATDDDSYMYEEVKQGS